jgi:polar amino acid transport system substrate-binding protein
MHIATSKAVKIGAGAVALVVGVVVLVATQSSRADRTLSSRVPRGIGADGVLTVGTDPTWAPAVFQNSGNAEPAGFEADLIRAVAELLNLRVSWRETSFQEVIDGVRGGRVELGAAALPISDAMLEQMLMIGYFQSGTQWAVASDTDNLTPDNACGRKVAVLTGTLQVDDLADRSALCLSNGRPPIVVHRYATVPQLTNAVLSGDDEAMLLDSAVCTYAIAQSEHSLRTVGTPYNTSPIGLAVNAADRQFAELLQQALAILVNNGTYSRILQHWRVADGAVTAVTVRP